MKTATIDGPAVKKSRRFWVDTRFLIGLVLIAASVAGVVTLVSAADSSVQVYTAREPLSQGDVVTVDDLFPSSARVDGAAELYLVAGEVPDEGLVITKPVGAGELIPLSAVGSPVGVKLSAIVVTLNGQLPGSVDAGSLVDLWSSRETENGVFGPPSVLVSSATVVRLVETEGLVVSENSAAVEVLVPRSRIARVLEAVANSDALSLVPVSLPVRG